MARVMDKCIAGIATVRLGCCMAAVTLVGCSTSGVDSGQKPSALSSIMAMVGHDKGESVKDDLETLKSQLEEQQALIQSMDETQQARIDEMRILQAQLKRQKVAIHITPMSDANAGRGRVATASTAYIATLEDDSQFSELQSLASKEASVIPSREVDMSVTLPEEAKFIAIKINLRYTKKRSQFLIPVSSLSFDEPLSLTVGACDVSIDSGLDPELAPDFMTKLKYYQQPLVSCL